MALRNIVLEGEPILSKISKPVKVFDENLWHLIDDMFETMVNLNGCGLAAPQVGILKRIIVVQVNNLKFEMINPEIVSKKGKTLEIEGCLSVNSCRGLVERPKEITIKGFDRYGNPYSVTATDWLARAFCHETDHLNGILFTNIMLQKEPFDKRK